MAVAAEDGAEVGEIDMAMDSEVMTTVMVSVMAAETAGDSLHCHVYVFM